MADGFLGRWSQRKQAMREGKTLAEPSEVSLPKPVPQVTSSREPALIPPMAAPVAQVESVAQVPAPSMQDVDALTAQSDFKPFVARSVAPEVRNAAMKKLFTDPHFNVMDRLDIYIDDYSLSDPLPESMLRQMASAKFLNLFDEQEDKALEAGVRDDADTSLVHSMAQSAQPPSAGAEPLINNLPSQPGTDHDHTDLRLQPNHAAGPDESGRIAE